MKSRYGKKYKNTLSIESTKIKRTKNANGNFQIEKASQVPYIRGQANGMVMLNNRWFKRVILVGTVTSFLFWIAMSIGTN